MTFSVVLYFGLCLLLLSVLALWRPPRALGIPNRMTALALALVALTVVAVAAAWPPPRTRTSKDGSLLSNALPEYQFEERHEIGICATGPRILEAVRLVTADEVPLLGLLMRVRGLPLDGEAERKLPLVEIAQRRGFVWLGEQPAREIVLGTGGPFWAAGTTDIADAGLLRIQLLSSRNDPGRFAHLELRGYPKAVIQFLVTGSPGECHTLQTVTRIGTATPESLRKFAVYWRLIHPGSALIRTRWLEAVKRRAEQPE